MGGLRWWLAAALFGAWLITFLVICKGDDDCNDNADGDDDGYDNGDDDGGGGGPIVSVTRLFIRCFCKGV